MELVLCLGECVDYSSIALIRLTPELLDCSFLILNVPSSDVFLTWGPAQISFEKFPIE